VDLSLIRDISSGLFSENWYKRRGGRVEGLIWYNKMKEGLDRMEELYITLYSCSTGEAVLDTRQTYTNV
jgi:hypothetical protein